MALTVSLLLLGEGRFILMLMMLAVFVALLFAILAYRLYFQMQNQSYSKTPGGLIYADRLCLNGDGGPRQYEWSDFGQAFISSHDGKPILQHLHVNDLKLDGYERFASYTLTPIDHLAISPTDFLMQLKAQPNFPDKGPVIDTRHD